MGELARCCPPWQEAHTGQLAQNHADLNINPSRGFIVAGESNGADIALALAHMYAEEQPPSPPLTGLFVACPMAMNRDTVPEKYKDFYISMDQNAKSPIHTAESIDFVICESVVHVRKGGPRR